MPTPSRLQVHTPNGHDRRPPAVSERALDAVREASSLAQEKITAAADTTEKVVKAHPLKSVGVALGGGILLGAIAARAFTRQMTMSEMFHDRLGLKRRIARAIQSWL